jgi:hypothetical protein
MNHGQGSNHQPFYPSQSGDGYSSSDPPPAAAAAAVARAPQDETLYETLLRYHGENDDSSDEVVRKAIHQQAQVVGNLKNDADYEDDSEDQKLPAKPAARANTNTSMHNPTMSAGRGGGNRPKPSPNAYQAALEESRRAAGVAPTDDMQTSKKPGIAYVNEPAVRPDSAMYRQVYGDVTQQRTNNQQPSRSMASPNTTSESPRRPQIANNQQGSIRSLPNSIPAPMGVDETRAALNALKQSRRGFGSSPNSPVDHARKESPLGAQETRAALEAIRSHRPIATHSPRVGSKVDEGDDDPFGNQVPSAMSPGSSVGNRISGDRGAAVTPQSYQGNNTVRSNFSSPGGSIMPHNLPLSSPTTRSTQYSNPPRINPSPRPMPANSQAQRVPTGSVPITPVDDEIDEDLLLALEISKNDTGNSAPANIAPAASRPNDHRGLSEDDRNNSSLRDVLLALQLSEEDQKSGFHDSSEVAHNRRMSTSLDTLLAMEHSRGQSGGQYSRERVTDYVAAGISTDVKKTPDEQFKILEQIREEQEKKELELALQVSQQEDGRSTSSSSDQDFMINQQSAMDGWSGGSANGANGNLKAPPPPTTSVSRQDSNERRRELVERGTAETQRAISTGQAHIVTCQGCKGRLQAPISYSLVYCPRCQIISPT